MDLYIFLYIFTISEVQRDSSCCRIKKNHSGIMCEKKNLFFCLFLLITKLLKLPLISTRTYSFSYFPYIEHLGTAIFLCHPAFLSIVDRFRNGPKVGQLQQHNPLNTFDQSGVSIHLHFLKLEPNIYPHTHPGIFGLQIIQKKKTQVNFSQGAKDESNKACELSEIKFSATRTKHSLQCDGMSLTT